ncbi:MAG TPA: hypothetical protein VMS96_08610 [Terriglobales bacterium]|nr:hypothetical protein [Terriglobales bacterium]
MNECPVCGEEYDSGESLQEHLRDQHPGHDHPDDLSPEEVIIAGIIGGDLDL